MDIVLHRSSCSGGGSSEDDDVGVGSSSPSLRSSDEVASMQSNKKQALLNKFLSSKSIRCYKDNPCLPVLDGILNSVEGFF